MEKEVDVIIVGTGVAGCFAALHFPENYKILMITKADLEESDSFLAQGGICVLKNEEDYESFFEDTMRAGHYENRKEAVDVMIKSSRAVIDELIHYGVDFARENEKLLYTKEGAHSTNRILYHEDITGKEITSKLLREVKSRRNITIQTHTTMLDILCKENSCHGILMKDQEGNIKPLYAKNVIWACGGIGGIYEHSTNFPHLTGDALALALRHHIKLKNVNYVQIHPTTLYSKKPGRKFLISESVRGEGAILLNKKDGVRFTNELMPRDVVTKAIHKQMKKDGTECVWLSMEKIPKEEILSHFPNIYKRCLEEGYDVTKEPIPVVPAQHYFMGGVEVNLQSKTSMAHLYAAGETSCNGVHGANRLASNSLLESLVFAKRAALDIVEKHVQIVKKESYAWSWEELEKTYGIDQADYLEEKRFKEENKALIWKEIEKENRNESNYNQTKCRQLNLTGTSGGYFQ